MGFSSILSTIDKFSKKAAQERLSSPQIIQKTKAVRYPNASGIHKAYCKADAGAATTIVCYLDTDGPGEGIEEITVNCSIAGGGNLNAAIPRLTDGLMISVWKEEDTWQCLWGFQHWDPCA